MGTCQTLPCLKCHYEHLACDTLKLKPQTVLLLRFLCSILSFHLVTPVFFFTSVTVQCTKDAFFIVIVGKDATVPRIDLETISMQGHGPGCTHVDSNSDFAIYYFAVTDCGTEVTVRVSFSLYFLTN